VPIPTKTAEFKVKNSAEEAKAENLLLLFLLFFNSNKTRLVLESHSTNCNSTGGSNNAEVWGRTLGGIKEYRINMSLKN